MSKYKIIADMHCHTIRSENAFATLKELVNEAKKKGLYGIAITDHGPREKYPAFSSAFRYTKDYLPEEIDGIRIYNGVEANVTNIGRGEIDFKESDFQHADWVIASYHQISEMDKSILNNLLLTSLYQRLINNPIVMMVGHPERTQFGYDEKVFVEECKKHAKVVEINESSIRRDEKWKAKIKSLALLCKEHSVPICVVSDAHLADEVGCFACSEDLLSQIEFPQRLIINSDPDLLNDYIQKFKTRANMISGEKR